MKKKRVKGAVPVAPPPVPAHPHALSAADALRQSQERLLKVEQMAHIGIWEWNLQSGTFHRDPENDRIFGLPPETAPSGEAFLAAVHPDDQALVKQSLADAMEGRKTLDLDMRIRCPDGREKVVHACAELERDAAGKPRRLSGTVQDVTVRKQAEEALRALSSRQDAILAAVPNIIAEVDTHKVYTWMNQAGLDFFGHDAIGKEAAFYFEGQQDTYDAVQPLFHGDSSVFYAASWQRRRDGEKRLLAWWCRVLKDATGNVTGALSSARDITERHQAEQALREREQRLASIYDTVEDVIFQLAVENEGRYRFASVNRAFLIVTGLTSAQVVGQRVDKVIPAPALSVVLEKYATAIREKRIVRWEETSDYPTGRLIGEVSIAPVFDEAGHCTHLIGAVHDITARKRAEDELRQNAAVLEAQLRASIDGILIVDGKGEKVVQNERCVELWRIPQHIIDDRDDTRQVEFVKNRTKDPEKFVNKLHDLYAHPDAISRDEVEFKDGMILDRYSAPVIGKDGTHLGRIWTFRDITGRKQAEEEKEKLLARLAQAEKMESIGALAGGVAHNFNNALMGILNYAELGRTILPADHPVRGYLNEITIDAQRSADLARQLLAFSRRQTIAPRVLGLNATVADAIKLVRPLLGANIDLVWTPDANLYPVKLDPAQIGQLLTTLCTNASEAITGQGRITLQTANVWIDQANGLVHADAVPGEYASLAVSDTGCGMDKETLKKVFEPFFTTKAFGERTGMGLASVYGIVKQNKGFIDVASEPGKGTTFTLYFPRVASAAKPAPSATPAIRSGGRKTVLLVDDEKSIRVTIRLFLENGGHTVLAAESPEEALRLAVDHAGPLDLLITDVILPGMNGRQLATRVQALWPDMKSLFMSGYTADALISQGALSEDMHFLLKPFSRDTLARTVLMVLEGG